MNKLVILLSGLAISAIPCTSALADTFSFSGSTFSASGNFTYTNTSTPGKFLGNTISGSALIGTTVVTITGFAPIATFLGNDNLYYTGAAAAALTGGRPFDFQGFAFTLSNGDAITLFSDAGSDFEILGNFSNGAEIATENSPISVTPEPGSLALLGTGALGLFGVLRRKFVA